MDFTISPELDKLRLRVRDFIAGEVLPLEDNKDNFNEFENIRLSLLTADARKSPQGGSVGTANAEGTRRPGVGCCRVGGVLRRSRAVDFRAGDPELPGA